MKYKYSLMYAGWTTLGFVRGANYYKYYEKEEPYMYCNAFGHGLLGGVLYANPVFLPLGIRKELYRAEVTFRNIEVDKKKYHDLF